tara:strand:+ start:801 stop:1019 length:219 start_codon:yes stop_codon:yes gene_type:complete
MNQETIELPLEFFESMAEYLESCAKESVLAARGVRSVLERYKELGATAQEVEEDEGTEMDDKDNVLSFPDST